MKRIYPLFFLFLFFFGFLSLAAQEAAIPATTLSSRIDTLIKHRLPQGSNVAIAVYDLTAGKPLYAYQADKLSRPASTMKLLTTITALARPEADEPFRTEVWYRGVIERDTLRGDLYVVGGFDPELDDEALDALADSVARFPLPFSVIRGKVVGDVSMKDSIYWGSGWLWDDNPAAFQPYLSPLMLNKGVVTVTALPGELGGSARLVCTPASSYYTLVNKTQSRTPAAGRFRVSRNWMTNGNRITVTGNVDGRRSGTVNLFSSQDFFMHTFVERLQARGIRVASDERQGTKDKGQDVWNGKHETSADRVASAEASLEGEIPLSTEAFSLTNKHSSAATVSPDSLSETSLSDESSPLSAEGTSLLEEETLSEEISLFEGGTPLSAEGTPLSAEVDHPCSRPYTFGELRVDSLCVRMAVYETAVQSVVKQIMKESDNLNAEAMLCRLGAQSSGRKHVSAEEGLDAIRTLTKKLGLNPNRYNLADGCGLSNYNYISPELLVAFLRFAYGRTDVFQKLYKALPIGGVDGTLKYRMRKGTPSYGNVHAKTGSFTAVNCLAGYLKTRNGHQIAFAIMNQNVLSGREARAFQDKVCDSIVNYDSL